MVKCPFIRNISERLSMISNTSGSKDKASLLALRFDKETDIEFKKFLNYVLDEVNYTYNLKKIPEYNLNQQTDLTIYDLFNLLEDMNNNSGGEEIKIKVKEFCDKADNELYSLFEMCIERSLNCGIDTKTIIKSYPELDHLISPYMRCEKEEMLDKRIKYPAIAQIKADGLFINIFTGSTPRFITRYGNEAIIEGILYSTIKRLSINVPNFAHHVIMGELLVRNDDGTILPREVGNGLINSYIKRFNTISNIYKKIEKAKTQKAKDKLQNELDEKIQAWNVLEHKIFIKFWDMITEEEFKAKKSDTPYSKRVEKVNNYLWLAFQQDPDLTTYIKPIDSKIVNSKQEVMDYFEEVLGLGEEGLVVKNLDLTWCHDVNRGGIIKLKEFKDCDLMIVGYLPGEGEYTGGIGALLCESSDGLLKVDPSSGLSMAQRGLERVDMNDSSKGWKPIEDFDLNQYNQKIVALKYNTIQKAENSETYSLFIPKIIEIREAFDKQTADSLEEILNGKK